MSNNEHREARDARRAFRCTFGPVREMDLVWPPPEEDLDAFSLVPVADGDLTEPPPAEVAPAPLARLLLKPTFGDCRDPGLAPRIRPLVVPMEPPPLPSAPDAREEPVGLVASDATPVDGPSPADEPLVFPVPVDAASRQLALMGRRRSAWPAVLLAAACALIAVVQFRAIFLPAEAGGSLAEQPPVPEGVSAVELAPGAPRVAPAVRRSQPPVTRTEPPTPPASKLDRNADAPARQVAATPVRPRPAPVASTPPAAPAPAPTTAQPRVAIGQPARAVPAPTPARVAVAVIDRGTPAPAASSVAPSAGPSGPSPVPAPVTTTASLAEPAPAPGAIAAATPPPVAAAVTEAASDDETGIRSALTRFRTAYSQLDARAARAVWPSVDSRALERAFQSLKSQDLRFDRCSLTVSGARAQAACKGRAIYVPRIGDQSPRFTAREWTFELQKADELWTIASARTL